MSIIYVPVHKNSDGAHLETSLPSVLEGRITPEEWEEITRFVSKMMNRRERLAFVKALSIVFLGPYVKKYLHYKIDREIERYLDKKNIALSDAGIFFHHPKERVYSGMDVSVSFF